ncbi:HET-domain-containing protein [Paxillus ammoniavirescens]|nr:HET-domain-containing protein [Paxillus ammoniavirescens]
MRLLNASTKQLEWFDDPAAVKFAIISHRWGDEEVTFTDISDPSACNKKGYKKIDGCCTRALQDGLQYIWMDTCCIDKSSSAELSEAINSMYTWYHASHVCYAYLADVPGGQKSDHVHVNFSKSVWFLRGWTLQELIAPTSVLFFAEDWTCIGSRVTLMHQIEHITGISSQVLRSDAHPGMHHDVSIAQKMFWAAKRETTRVEDRAYSLLGLFGKSMPAIYGEGEKAFEKLQLEIMKASDDQSLFAWTLPRDKSSHTPFPNVTTRLLASTPSQYAANVYKIPFDDFFKSFVSKIRHHDLRSNFSMINNAVRITLPIKPFRGDVYKALLCCSFERRTQRQLPLVIYLQKVNAPRRQFVRTHVPFSLEPFNDGDMKGFTMEEIDVVEPPSNMRHNAVPPHKAVIYQQPLPSPLGAVVVPPVEPHRHQTINIIICSEPGVGTHKVINLVTGLNIGNHVGEGDGCVLASTPYDISLGTKNIRIFHTVGLRDHQMDIDGYLKAIERAYTLVQSLTDAGGVHLLLFCMLGVVARPTVMAHKNHQLFYEFLCNKKVPTALVIIGLGKEKRMEDWWGRNKENLGGIGAGCVGHACITVVRDNTPGQNNKYAESKETVHELLRQHATGGSAFLPDGWFVMLGRKMMNFIPNKRLLQLNDIKKVLTKSCNVDSESAGRMAEDIVRL